MVVILEVVAAVLPLQVHQILELQLEQEVQEQHQALMAHQQRELEAEVVVQHQHQTLKEQEVPEVVVMVQVVGLELLQ